MYQNATVLDWNHLEERVAGSGSVEDFFYLISAAS